MANDDDRDDETPDIQLVRTASTVSWGKGELRVRLHHRGEAPGPAVVLSVRPTESNDDDFAEVSEVSEVSVRVSSREP